MVTLRHKNRGERERDDDTHRLMPLFGVLALVLAVVVYIAVVPQEAPHTSGNSVAATIFPIYDIAKNVAGDAVEVTLILPPGASPHTFEPSPSTLRTVREASAIYSVGHGLDDWIDALIIDAGSRKVTVDAKIPFRASEELGDEKVVHDIGDTHAHGDVDPHYWLDARNAMTIARTIADDLSTRYPEQADAIGKNLDRYLSALRTLHADITEEVGTAKEYRLVTLHDGWGYFADAYGLEIVGTFEPSPGREPTPKYLSDLMDAVRVTGTTRLFTEPQIGTGSLETFLDDNGLSLAMLDPLGGGPARESYVAMMRYNAGVIAGK